MQKNKEVQEKVYDEVSNFGPFQNDRIMDWLGNLKYTQRCIEESLRFYPPAYVIDRQAAEDDTVQDIALPKGSLILMSVFELHRHRDFWKDAEAYNPDRFEEMNSKELNNYYYPFGAGPRMCIGNNFAMYEMIMTIARIYSGL